MSGGRVAPIERGFYRGQYQAVLALSIDARAPKLKPKDLGWVIGALSFLGRIDEAEVLFKSRQPSLSRREKIQAHFFLGVGFSRQSRHEQARKYFGLNLKEKRRGKLNPDLLFFIYQGLSFNRYFSGRFRAAATASSRSFAAAMAGDLYGKALASDMRGHILVQLGEVSAGIRSLKQAMKFAELLGNKAIAHAIQISILAYRAEFGFDPKSSLQALQTALKDLSPQDTYSRSSLLLELARQQMLRGTPAEATRTLDEAAEIIYSTQNRRHEVVLNLRYSYLLFLCGEPSRALVFMRSAKKSLSLAVDRALLLATLGLECKLLAELNTEAPRGRLARMSAIYGGKVQARMTERGSRTESTSASTGDDPLGRLIDDVAKGVPEAQESILATGYLSFLYDALKIPRSTRVIYLGLRPGTITLFERGEVRHSEGLTAHLRALVIEIASGHGSKRSLVEKIWGYSYHPLRHDSVVYSAVTTFRKLLGDKASWLETTENGYRFADGTTLRFPESCMPEAVTSDQRSLSTDATSLRSLGLNLRQLRILQYLRKSEAIDVRTCRQIFKTSEITASRDLSKLKQCQLVVRVGHGRATQYILFTEQGG